MKKSSIASARSLLLSALLVLSVFSMNLRLFSADRPAAPKRTPVILDTDIGDDIDDTWALGLLLRSPELDLKLVVGDQGRALYRARLLAKFLEVAGRSDVPVGVGLESNRTGDGPQSEWIKGYDLKKYPGKVHADGVQAIIDTIMGSAQPVTLIAIGPVPNLAAALARQPRIAERARFVGMHGSVRLGYGGSQKPAAEYNVKADAKACQKVFTAPWAITITPLDTCGLVQLDGALYRRMREAKSPIAKAVMENYCLWDASKNKSGKGKASDTRSSILFDTVAVYLALSEQLLKMEDLNLRVTGDGFTVIDSAAKKMAVATEWRDLEGFKVFLVDRLTQP